MADNKNKRGGADRALIALSEAYEVNYWSKKFKVTPAKLKSAVKKVGRSAKKVEAHFADQKRKARDQALIAISQPYEVRYWSKKFKVTPAKLKAAVKKVGHSAKKVEAYFAEERHKARDRALIAVSQPHEVRYWAKKFKVTPAKLKAAVGAVGHSSKKVGEYLAKPKKAKKAKKAVKAKRAKKKS
jgi:uncharacterized protein DUF3606